MAGLPITGRKAGGWFGAKLAVKGGEKLVRVFMIFSALYLAGRLIGLCTSSTTLSCSPVPSGAAASGRFGT